MTTKMIAALAASMVLVASTAGAAVYNGGGFNSAAKINATSSAINKSRAVYNGGGLVSTAKSRAVYNGGGITAAAGFTWSK